MKRTLFFILYLCIFITCVKAQLGINHPGTIVTGRHNEHLLNGFPQNIFTKVENTSISYGDPPPWYLATEYSTRYTLIPHPDDAARWQNFAYEPDYSLFQSDTIALKKKNNVPVGSGEFRLRRKVEIRSFDGFIRRTVTESFSEYSVFKFYLHTALDVTANPAGSSNAVGFIEEPRLIHKNNGSTTYKDIPSIKKTIWWLSPNNPWHYLENNNNWNYILRSNPFSPHSLIFKGVIKPGETSYSSNQITYNYQPGKRLVTNTAASGAGSLPTEINFASPGDTIEFGGSVNSGDTVFCNNSLNITKHVYIRGFKNSAPIRITIVAPGNTAIRVSEKIKLRLENITLANSAGGVVSFSESGLELFNCSIVNNNGIGVKSMGNTLEIFNCTISGNINSESNGGGVYIVGNVSPAVIRSSTIINNKSKNTGGGIYFEYPLVNKGAFLKNNIIANNKFIISGNERNSDFNTWEALTWPAGTSNPYQSSGYNLIGSGRWYFNTIASDIVGTENYPINPQVGPLAANGVTNRPFTHALNGCGSPAVNAGSNDGALTLDQRGFNVSGGQRDIGAFELQPSDPSSNQPGVKYVTTGAPDGPGSLKYLMEHLNCADTIRFNVKGIKIFLNGIITPNNNVVVDGTGSNIIISGQNQPGGLNRILEVGNRTVFLKDLTISDVNRTGSSGAFSILSGGKLTLQGCLITNNRVTQRGGVVYLINGATLNINNCTISGNEATEMGGAIYVDGGTLRIENSTIAFNKTTSTNSSFGGGAIAVSSVATTADIRIFNSIIAKNTSASNGEDIKQALNRINAAEGSHNIFGILEPGVSGTITHRTGDVSGTLASPLDPQLQSLQSNGGLTKTHAIGCGSIAYQTGLFNNTAGNSIGNALVDQRQVARVSPHDKGAFEIGQGTTSNMTFHNSMITDTSVINISSSNINRYKTGSLMDALLNICDEGTIMADDSSTTYNTSGAITNTRYRQYDYIVLNNKPIEITKNVTIDFNHAKITRSFDPFAAIGANLFKVNAGKTLTIKNAWFTPSVQFDGNLGGFAFVQPTGKIRFENCRISGMKADTGAVVYGGKIEAITCQFDNDSATIGNVFYSTDSVILKGCTITENHRLGHVIFMNGSNAKLVLANNVIGDTGTVGAGNARDIHLVNSATVASQGYNLVSSSASPPWGASGDYDGVFVKNQTNLEGVSSVTKGTVFRPACNSLALNTGNPGSYGLLTDINGNQRYNDRGAFERGTVRYVTNTDTSVYTVGSLPYVVANSCDSIIFDRILEDESFAVSGLHLRKPIAGQSGSAQNLYVKSSVRVNLIGSTPTRNEPVFYVDSVDNLNVTIDGLTFSANGGTAEGAAINSKAYAATTVIKNCTFSGNTSTNPNAMVISGRNTNLIRSTIAYNTGAGAPVYSNSSGMLISGSTIANNTTTGLAGGVAVNSSISTITNSIIAKNQFGAGGADIRRISGTLNGSYNFIGVYNPAAGFSSSVGDTLGTAAAPINPKLDTALKVNAGINTFNIRTLALTDSSSCINRADPTSFPADQRGFPTVNGRNDIGAFEYNPTCMSIDSAFTDRIGPNNARLNFYGGNASHYLITYRSVDSVNWLVAGAPNFSFHQWQLSGLQAGLSYVWRIQSYCWGGKDSASSYVERYFTTQCSLPDSVWVSAQDTTSLGFTWTNMPGNSGYILQLRNMNDTLLPVISVTKAVNDTSHLFTGIGFADEFEFKIFTRCGSDTSDFKQLFAKTDTIPYLKVISPNSPVEYITCGQHTVFWESFKAGNSFKIEISYNNKASYTVLNSNYSVVNNQEVYYINLPINNYDSCYVRVTSINVPALIDENDTAFRINNQLPIPVFNGVTFNMCKGSTQQLVIVPDTLHLPYYSWSLPFGYTGSSDSNKITITAPNFDTSGVIQVFARTNCDSSLVLSIPTTTRVTNLWTGAVSTQWNNIGNWSCNFIPGVTDNVEIPSGVPNMPTVSAGFNAQIGNLTIKPGATVTVVNTATLNVKLELKLEGNGQLNAQPGSTILVRSN